METLPSIRHDLEFFPIQHQGQQYVLIRDALGLVPEGKAVGLPLYHLMTFLDGVTSVRDAQMALMRHQGGTLVGIDEINGLLAHLDESYLLDSDRYRAARARIIADFTSEQIRPCSHCGKSYPDDPAELTRRLNDILNSQPLMSRPSGRTVALIAPHIDLNVGYKGYATAYQMLKPMVPSRIILLGIGHQMQEGLFCLTDKDFQSPLGLSEADRHAINGLRDSGRDIIAPDDFIHRSEHSIEFQIIFLQHLMKGHPFAIIPILCGSLMGLREYSRSAYLDTSGAFLGELKTILTDPAQDTLLVAGVDFSHIGPKFGHERTAASLETEARTHDQNLLNYLTGQDADHFWEESRDVRDQFNVCGFSALACLLEILPPCHGEVLHYEIWHEAPTRSAVSFASAVFTT